MQSITAAALGLPPKNRRRTRWGMALHGAISPSTSARGVDEATGRGSANRLTETRDVVELDEVPSRDPTRRFWRRKWMRTRIIVLQNTGSPLEARARTSRLFDNYHCQHYGDDATLDAKQASAARGICWRFVASRRQANTFPVILAVADRRVGRNDSDKVYQKGSRQARRHHIAQGLGAGENAGITLAWAGRRPATSQDDSAERICNGLEVRVYLTQMAAYTAAHGDGKSSIQTGSRVLVLG